MSHPPQLPAFMQSFAARVREVPFWIRLSLFAAAFATTGYWSVTDSGLYRLFRDGPSRTATELIFYPRAMLFTFGVTLIPVTLVLLVLSRRSSPAR